MAEDTSPDPPAPRRTPALQRALVVGLTLLLAHVSASVADLYAVSGIVTWLGRQKVLVLWGLEALLSIAFAAGASAALGRIAPRRMLGASVLAAGLGYVLCAALLFGGVAAGPLLAAVAVVDKLLFNVAYFAAWALARQLFDARETVRWFGPINAATFLGSLLGTATAGFAARRGFSPMHLMMALATMLLLGRALLSLLLRATETRGALEPPPSPTRLRDALAHLRDNALLKSMALLSVCNGMGYTVLSYEVIRRFAESTEHSARALGRFAILYAALRIAEPLVYAVLESFVAAPVIRRARATTLFLGPPSVLVFAHLSLFVLPSPVLALFCACTLQGAFALDEPLRSGFVASQPHSLRVTLGAINDGTFYQLGYLVGSLSLGTLLLLTAVFHLGERTTLVLELGLGVTAGLGGILSVRRLAQQGLSQYLGSLRGSAPPAPS